MSVEPSAQDERGFDDWEPGPDRIRVLLVRHGRTAWNAERRFLGATDLGLDAVGHEQAARLAAWLPVGFDAIYSSPLTRAFETALHLGDPTPVDALRELDQGALEGLKVDEATARYPDFFAAWAEDPTAVAVPGGETLGACRDRARHALEGLVARHRGGDRIAVVTHQLVIGALACTLADQPLRRWSRFGVPNASVTVLGWREGRWELGPMGLEPPMGSDLDPKEPGE